MERRDLKTTKQHNPHEIIVGVFKEAIKAPCAVCTGKAEAVASFKRSK